MERKGANSSYFGDILESIKSLFLGLRLTLKHIFQATKRRNNSYISDKNYFDQKTGLVTLQYPYESIPVPDNGRYRLHNEIDDCIVCDKCAKVCPVDCITIESIKAPEEIGKTSDGTSKRLYAPIFDIDLAKCCYCGLCTTVCPTECLTMTKVYDFSEKDVDNFIYKFSDMTPTQAEEKRKEAELVAAQKEAAKLAAKSIPAVAKESAAEEKQESKEITTAARPAFKPKFKAASGTESKVDSSKTPEDAPSTLPTEKEPTDTPKPLAKPVFRPKVRPTTDDAAKTEKLLTSDAQSPSDPDKGVREDLPGLEQGKKSEPTAENQKEEVKPAAKPVFRPKIRPIKPPGETEI